MIIGHGLIARELRAQGAAAAIFYAAGVSNSRCNDPAEFARDEARLLDSFWEPARLVYFSSCSVEFEDTPYTAHKRRMEGLVLARQGAVLRLPNVVGRAAPDYQLLPYLCNRLHEGLPLVLQRDARRNLVDVADVARIARGLTKMSGVCNVAAEYDHSLSEIVATLEYWTACPATIEFVDGGRAHKITESVLQTGPDYMYHVIGKYFDRRIPARAAA